MATRRIGRRAFGLTLVGAVAAACGGKGRAPEATPVPNVQQEFRPTPSATGAAGTLKWSTRAPLPTPRSEVASAVLDGKIYVIGGFLASGQSSNIVEAYDPAANTWSRKANLPEPRDHAMAAAVDAGALFDKRIFVFGGSLGAPTKTVFAYDAMADHWSRVSDMDFRRTAGGAAFVHGSAIIILGGTGDSPEQTEAYDPFKDAWKPSPPFARREHLAVVPAGNAIYAIGGRWDGVNSDAAAIWENNITGWQALPSMPTARGGTAGAFVGGKVYVAGGEAFDPTRTFAQVDVYDPAAGSWSKAPDLPTPRHGLCVQGVGNVLYVIGGGPTAGLSVAPQNEALTVS